jgi:hypothetical protein
MECVRVTIYINWQAFANTSIQITTLDFDDQWSNGNDEADEYDDDDEDDDGGGKCITSSWVNFA